MFGKREFEFFLCSYVINKNNCNMKQLALFTISFFISLSLFAQEPGNNLRKSLAQIQQSFPNLKYLHEDKGYKVYKSSGEDEDFTTFYFNNNGLLVGEYTYIFDYSGSGYITDLYNSLFNRFAKYGVKHKRSTSPSYDVTFFYFSNFIVKFANYHTQLQIYYELNGLHINVNALQARPPRY